MARILIVEETLNAIHGRALLEQAGYKVVATEVSGRKAISSSAELRPDITLVDVYLSGTMCDAELASVLLSRYAIPSLFITTYTA